MSVKTMGCLLCNLSDVQITVDEFETANGLTGVSRFSRAHAIWKVRHEHWH